jgi:hypothetical protein
MLSLNTDRGTDFKFAVLQPVEELERDLSMKLTVLKALLLPIACLALGGINHASAATCNASYTMTAVTAGAFSCTIGDLTFSNFAASYVPGGGAGTPDPTADITVNFAESSSVTDPFGVAATDINPIYSVITDYTAGNSVGDNQTLAGVVTYSVTDTAIIPGTSIMEVDGAITGVAANTATGSLNKDICPSTAFVAGAFPAVTCSTGAITATSDLVLIASPSTQADGTPDFSSPFTLSSMGVYDSWTLNGGTTDPTATADVTAVENDFIETGIVPPTPEPGTFVLFGGALVGLLVIRRRRKLA